MEQPVFSFEPSNLDTDLFIIALLAFLGGTAGAIVMFWKKNNRTAYTGLTAMLLGMVALIAFATAIFSGWDILRTPAIHIYATKIKIGNQIIPFDQINNAVVENTNQTAALNPSILKESNSILLIELQNGKTYAFSSKNYSVREVMARLKQSIGDWEQQHTR